MNTEKLVITRTTEEVIENPRLVLENLQYELQNIDTEKKRIAKLEAEILENINLICSNMETYLVNVTEK
jgi:SHS2 domain-containing protein